MRLTSCFLIMQIKDYRNVIVPIHCLDVQVGMIQLCLTPTRYHFDVLLANLAAAPVPLWLRELLRPAFTKFVPDIGLT